MLWGGRCYPYFDRRLNWSLVRWSNLQSLSGPLGERGRIDSQNLTLEFWLGMRKSGPWAVRGGDHWLDSTLCRGAVSVDGEGKLEFWPIWEIQGFITYSPQMRCCVQKVTFVGAYQRNCRPHLTYTFKNIVSKTFVLELANLCKMGILIANSKVI